MIKFISSLLTNKCKLVQRMTQSNKIIASLFSNKFKLVQNMCKLISSKGDAIMSKHEFKEAKKNPKN